jgi:peptide chain release factor subunit 1
MVLDDLLKRLSDFEPNGFPVISLYLDARPGQNGRDNYQAFVRKEFRSRARTFASGSSERESFDLDVAQINRYLENELRPSANGLALFACAGAGLFETVEMEVALPGHRLYLYDQPHLYDLARINDEYPLYAAAICDTNSARLYVFGLGQVLAKEEINGSRTRAVKVGGWSQARYRRHIENYHVQHLKEVAGALDRIVADENIRHVVLAGDEVAVSKLRAQLSQPLEDKIVDMLRLDINAADAEVLKATLDSLRRQDAEDDAARVERLRQECRSGGLAVAGPESTLEALNVGQADEVLISASLQDLQGNEQKPDELVTKAQQTGAAVRFIQDPELLAWADGVGALLRYRI